MSRHNDHATVVVTGGARGIGRGLAKRFQQSGYKVAIWDIDPSPLDEDGDFESASIAPVDVSAGADES